MSNEQEKSLIGFDPLAWLANEPEPVQSEVDTEIVLPSDDLAPTELVAEALSVSEPVEVASDVNLLTDINQISDKIVLDAVLNIRNVQTLHQRFCQMLDSYSTIEIDASQVSSVDTANLQLLLVLKRTAVNLQKQVNIDFPSEKFIEASELLGISEMLEVDQAYAGLF